MNLCKKIRWKGSQEIRKNPELLRRAIADNLVQYSCLQTFQPWGPDGRLVAPERCSPSRSCHCGEKTSA